MAGTGVVKLGPMFQVGFAIKDADKIAGIWTRDFGFHDWRTKYLEGVDGKGNPWKAKLVMAYMGTIEYELIEPEIGRIAQSRLLETWGDGIHHVKFAVDNVAEETNKLKDRPGCRIIWQIDRLSYCEIPGGVIVEFVRPPDQWENEKAMGNDIVNLGDLAQVGIAVKDIDTVVKQWSDIFGVTSWRETEFKGTEADGSPWKNRIMSAKISNMNFEFMTPVQGRRTQAVFLEKHGDGIHHLAYKVKDFEAATNKLLAKPGYSLVARHKGQMAYVEIPGGFIIELWPETHP